MRKLLVLTLVQFVVALISFADDARLLPKGVLRVRTIGGYTVATHSFDADGDRVALSGNDSMQTVNVGAAMEYGVLGGFNLLTSWAPGYNVYSKLASDDLKKINGPFDLSFGATLQILGERAVFRKLRNDTFRFNFALGVLIPMPGADFNQQSLNRFDGLQYIAWDPDRHAPGPWARANFDFVVNRAFFINLYSEFITYLTDHQDWLLPMPFGVAAGDVRWAEQLTVEAEPHFEMDIARGMQLKAGLPLTFIIWAPTEYLGIDAPDSEGYRLNLRPRVGLFFHALRVPIEAEIGYSYPLLGKNVGSIRGYANQAITVQLMAIADFRRKPRTD
jgi:hypothetical protein